MYQENLSFKKPEESNTKIWRYMDFTKFMDLLNTNALFFPATENFNDKFEGSIPISAAKNRMEVVQKIYKDIEENHDGLKYNLDYNKDPFTPFLPGMRKEVCISCWHMNEHESAAMWGLYLKSNEGIAVQSSYEKLIDSFLSTNIVIHVGKVEYIDFEKERDWDGSFFTPFFCKRKSFEHEKELRAVIWTEENGNKEHCKIENGGLKINIDLSKFIEKIYVSPDSPFWFTNLINDITRKFGLDTEVKNSGLNGEPIY